MPEIHRVVNVQFSSPRPPTFEIHLKSAGEIHADVVRARPSESMDGDNDEADDDHDAE